MFEFVVKYWLEVVFTLFLSGIGIAVKFIWNEIKKDYLDVVKQNQEEIRQTNEKFAQFQNDINKKFNSLNEKMDEMQEQSRSSDLAIIRDSLLRKIRMGLQGDSSCISMADYETVSSLMTQYEKLGGNGEVHKLYKRYESIKICPEHDHTDDCSGC